MLVIFHAVSTLEGSAGCNQCEKSALHSGTRPTDFALLVLTVVGAAPTLSATSRTRLQAELEEFAKRMG